MWQQSCETEYPMIRWKKEKSNNTKVPNTGSIDPNLCCVAKLCSNPQNFIWKSSGEQELYKDTKYVSKDFGGDEYKMMQKTLKKRWQMTITRQWTRNIRTLRRSCVSEGENPKNGLKQYLCICSLYCTVTLCIIIQSSVMCQQGFSCHPTQNVWASPLKEYGCNKKIFCLLTEA